MKIIGTNKKAHFNYNFLDKIEAGIELKGTEVKSLQKGNFNFNDAYIIFKKNEAYILNMHIAPYEQGNIFNGDPYRVRKLLLHKREIIKLEFLIKKEAAAIIPLKIYWKKSKIKVEIALAKSKKKYDKRETIKQRDLSRLEKY